MNRVKRWSVGLFSTVLIAAGMLAGQTPAPAQAVNDPYILVAGDVACDASTLTGNVSHAVNATHCAQGTTGALFDPNYRKPSPGGTGAGYFTSSGTYGTDPSRVVAAGDVQYDDGWRDSFDYAGTSGAIDPDTFCSGLASAAGPNGDCSFDQTWGLAASQNAGLSTKVNDGVLASPGDHDWQGGLTGNSGGHDSKWNWTNCTFLFSSTQQACGFQSYFKYTAANVFAPASTYYDPDTTWGSYVNKVNCSGTGCSPLTIIVPDTGACTGTLANQNLCADNGAVANWTRTAIADATANPANACTIVVNYAARYADFQHGDTGPNNSLDEDGLWHAMFPSSVSNPRGYVGDAGQQPDLILSGHDHGYERSKRIDVGGSVVTGSTGIRSVTIGTGGITTNQQALTGNTVFPAGNTAWAFDYWTDSSMTSNPAEAVLPGVEQISWNGAAHTMVGTHYTVDTASGEAPNAPTAGDTTGSIACH